MARKSKPVSRRSECDIDDNCAVHVAMLQSLISTRIMVQKEDRSCAKYAPPILSRRKPFFKSYSLKCPHCNHSLAHKRPQTLCCPQMRKIQNVLYYPPNLNKVDKKTLGGLWQNKYKPITSTGNSR